MLEIFIFIFIFYKYLLNSYNVPTIELSITVGSKNWNRLDQPPRDPEIQEQIYSMTCKSHEFQKSLSIS